MDVPYNRLNSVIINSYVPLYASSLRYKPSVAFEDYIKSQLHLNIVDELFSRSVITYGSAYAYIKGDTSHFEEYKQVLRYYYLDLANVILKNTKHITEDFSIIPPMERLTDKIPVIPFDRATIKKELQDFLDTGIENNTTIAYSEILFSLDVSMIDDITQKGAMDIIVEAFILKHLATSSITYYLEVK